jgi:hypothetical protein
MHRTGFDGSCDPSPIWELTFSGTLGVEGWMAKVQIIYFHVAIDNSCPTILFLRVPG